jgi:hypothetical protein
MTFEKKNSLQIKKNSSFRQMLNNFFDMENGTNEKPKEMKLVIPLKYEAAISLSRYPSWEVQQQ